MAIQRFKDQADWSVDEITQNRRDGTVPETDDYIAARAKALADAGLEDEGDAPGLVDDDGLTVAGHLRRIQEPRP